MIRTDQRRTTNFEPMLRSAGGVAANAQKRATELEARPALEVVKSPRARSTSFLKTMATRVKSAAVKGLLAATIIGATLGATTLEAQAQVMPRGNQVVGVQVLQQQQQFIYSQAAIDAATQGKASFDSISAKAWDGQVATLSATKGHAFNVWRDTPTFNRDGTLNAYVEIEKGDRNKYEFDIEKNSRELDRVIHDSVGGYPMNYGFVPGTFSWDGDPFDVIVLGPKIDGGQMVKGKIVGIYHMVDEKGFDPHLVISPVNADGEPLYQLDPQFMQEVGSFVDRYKLPDAHKGKWAKFTGWGDAAEGRKFVETTSGLFEKAVSESAEIKQVMREAPSHRPLKILLTGFDAFDGRAKNMTGEVLSELAATRTGMTAISLDTLTLPVEYENAARVLMEHIERTKPDLVMSLGESENIRGVVEIERRALNQNGGKRDNRGVSLNGRIVQGGPDHLVNAFDLEALKQRAKGDSRALRLVIDDQGPGQFVCNEIYFRAMSALRERGLPIVFAHVPTTVSATRDQVTAAVRSLIDSAAEMIREAGAREVG